MKELVRVPDAMTMTPRESRLLPLWLKIAYTTWFAVWLPGYVLTHPPVEFLWFCHVGSVVMLIALWRESALLISWQAVSLLILQSLWTIDVIGRAALGFHPIGGTEYMFREGYPFFQKFLSSFHIPYPFLLAYALWKLGYDRRAIYLQIAATVFILAASFFLDTHEPKRNVNWVYRLLIPGLAETAQRLTRFNDYGHLLLCMVTFPIVIYLPSHLIFRWLAPPPRKTGAAADKHPSENRHVDRRQAVGA